MAYSILRPVGCYVYTHRKATTGDIFYVGKGTAERAWDRYGRSAYWCRVVAKHGLVIRIEAEGLPEFDAHARERELIASLKSKGVRLANLTDGGEGALNPSPEARAKIGAAHKGRKKSLEHIAKIRQSNLGQQRSEETKEKIRRRVISDETRAKMSAAATSRPVISEQTRVKLSEASKKMWTGSKYRATVSEALTGKKRDASFRAKMTAIALTRAPASTEARDRVREAMLAKWADPEYRRRMQVAHAGKGWSESRRAAHLRKKAA